MRVLVLCNDYWHPGKVIIDGLNGIDTSYDFDFFDRVARVDPTDYEPYDTIILARGNNLEKTEDGNWCDPWMTKENFDKLSSFVDAGGSLFVIHSGTTYKSSYPQLKELFGGIFTSHPEQCPVTHNITPNTPIANGVADFTVMDEHYHMELNDGNDIFLTSSSMHSTQPAGWTRLQGKGKVCVLTPGHIPEVWADENFKIILRNCLKWCQV